MAKFVECQHLNLAPPVRILMAALMFVFGLMFILLWEVYYHICGKTAAQSHDMEEEESKGNLHLQ